MLLPIVIAVVCLIILIVLLGVRQIPQSQAAIVERLGRYHKTLHPGINLIIPFLDQVKRVKHVNAPSSNLPANRMDMREQVLDVKEQKIISKDNVQMEVDTVVFYQITEPHKVFYEIADPIEAIKQICMTTVRSVFGEMDLDESLSSRERVNSRLRSALDEVTDKWGIKVLRVEIQKMDLETDLINTMKKQMIAERNRRAAVAAAEGEKQAAILKAEGVKRGAVLEAEAEKESMVLRAEAEKTKRILEADGEAQSIRMVEEATARGLEAVRSVLGNMEGVQAVLTLETLKTQEIVARELASGSNSKFYLPMNLAGLYGAIDGVKELLMPTMQSGPSPKGNDRLPNS
jgi:regulator of protease activity HflC (stomatin/prohibitin superfamily)